MDVLRWAREHGCPWNAVEVCLAGATCDAHMEVARWVMEQQRDNPTPVVASRRGPAARTA